MENIRFRAWNKDKKQMFLSPREPQHLGSWFDAHLPGSLADVSNIEIMQYAGLKNKQGVDFYEGDIIPKDGQNCVLVFGKKTLGFGYHFKYKTSWNTADKFYRLSSKDEVIGNIYQHPELLTK